MQILLLLSALLSAVTGAFAGPRTMDARVERAEAQIVAPARPVARAEAEAPKPIEPCKKINARAAPPLPAQASAPVSPPLASVCLIE